MTRVGRAGCAVSPARRAGWRCVRRADALGSARGAHRRGCTRGTKPRAAPASGMAKGRRYGCALSINPEEPARNAPSAQYRQPGGLAGDARGGLTPLAPHAARTGEVAHEARSRAQRQPAGWRWGGSAGALYPSTPKNLRGMHLRRSIASPRGLAGDACSGLRPCSSTRRAPARLRQRAQPGQDQPRRMLTPPQRRRAAAGRGRGGWPRSPAR